MTKIKRSIFEWRADFFSLELASFVSTVQRLYETARLNADGSIIQNVLTHESRVRVVVTAQDGAVISLVLFQA